MRQIFDRDIQMPESPYRDEVDVLIIGAGVSGIGMACTLTTECPAKTWTILERRQRLGGTWDLFAYPGVRSDSDMLAYGYGFRPWLDAKVLADGALIRDYLADTAREYGVDRHIRYGMKVTIASWSSSPRRWTVTACAEEDGKTIILTCAHLVMCTGYYDYDAGYMPDFPGIDQYTGDVLHPQHWPEGVGMEGRRVVVVGSGASAVTIVPAVAREAAHVTMLQRTPSYILSLPSRDALTEALSRVVSRPWAFRLARRRNIMLAHWIYQASRRWPAMMRAALLWQVRRQLAGSADMAHFTPPYMPWDQRLCIVPDGDFFVALRSGKASIVTDRIEGFEGNKILLASGGVLEADILVTATGFNVQTFGGIRILVDGRGYAPQRHMLYKSVLMENLPNFAWIVGYTNQTWTLKADIAAAYICRLIKHLDEHGLGTFCPRDTEGCAVDESVFGNLTSGYVMRAKDVAPRQGSRAPWRVTHHYPTDKATLLEQPVDDGVLCFEIDGRRPRE